MMNKPFAIGVDDYKRIIERSYYYVDKTLFIKELIDRQGTVNLITRPRRFGKTLALTTIQAFFEQERDEQGGFIDNSRYFENTNIGRAGELYLSKMGRYPVIMMSLKSARQPDYAMAYESLKDEIIREYVRHRYVLWEPGLTEEYRERYQAIMSRKAEPIAYAKALAFLSECLKACHKENVIILLDEYDVPLENAHFRGFYEQMVDFIRSLLESALKTNSNLEFAVITGCLRISRESIFTGLNNLEIISILNPEYAGHFGFSHREVEQMLKDYGLSYKKQEIRDWYDGYLFGDEAVYNPWSVVNYVKDATVSRESYPRPYWSNTSSNSIIRELVEAADMTVKQDIEQLIDGGVIEKEVHEDITYGEIHQNGDNLWNFLFFTGYLKAVSRRFENDILYLTLKIPNKEVRYIYSNTIQEWFDKRLKQADFTSFYRALLRQDTVKMEQFINSQLMGSISYYDNAENFYHGYMIGVLSALEGYGIASNREQGNGRPDIVLRPFTPNGAAVLIELKRAESFGQMEGLCDEALRQMEERNYERPLLEEGYGSILKYGICFCKKACKVKTYGVK